MQEGAAPLNKEFIFKVVDLIGKRFGKLKVIKLTGTSRSGSREWECLCDCGKTSYHTTRHLNRNPKHGTTKSCGCLTFKKGKEHKDWKGFGDIGASWWIYHVEHSIRSKNRKELVNDLTLEQAWELFLKQEGKCRFSGEDLVIDNNGKINTASIDRIDNTIGYTLSNVQWVHKHVNMMKRTYPDEYFISFCEKIANYQKNKKNP